MSCADVALMRNIFTAFLRYGCIQYVSPKALTHLNLTWLIFSWLNIYIIWGTFLISVSNNIPYSYICYIYLIVLYLIVVTIYLIVLTVCLSWCSTLITVYRKIQLRHTGVFYCFFYLYTEISCFMQELCHFSLVFYFWRKICTENGIEDTYLGSLFECTKLEYWGLKG